MAGIGRPVGRRAVGQGSHSRDDQLARLLSSQYGPRWVLVGDAGHFKDFTPAQGISDALRQAKTLRRIHLYRPGPRRAGCPTAALVAVASTRDAYAMYWLARDMGVPGASTPLITSIMGEIAGSEAATRQLLRVLNPRTAPSEAFTAARVAEGRRPRTLISRANPSHTRRCCQRTQRRRSAAPHPVTVWTPPRDPPCGDSGSVAAAWLWRPRHENLQQPTRAAGAAMKRSSARRFWRIANPAQQVSDSRRPLVGGPGNGRPTHRQAPAGAAGARTARWRLRVVDLGARHGI